MRLGATSILIISLCCGCTSATISKPSASWINRNGGLDRGAPVQRVESIASRFESVVDRPFRVHVLANETPGAWSWPSGDLFLTSHLVALLDDNEVAAVVGHELGHLVCDQHIEASFALTGTRHADPEIAADQAGLKLLATARIPTQSLRSALQKISSDKNLNPAFREQLSQRISLLP